MTDLNKIQRQLNQVLIEIPDLGVTNIGEKTVYIQLWHNAEDPNDLVTAELCPMSGEFYPAEKAVYTAMYIIKALMSQVIPIDED